MEAAQKCRLGLTERRIAGARFNANKIMKVGFNHKMDPPAFDQSDLARLLVTLMSQETCRSTDVAFDKAGFLARSKSPFKSILVQSSGRLEDVFARHLRRLRQAVTSDD